MRLMISPKLYLSIAKFVIEKPDNQVCKYINIVADRREVVAGHTAFDAGHTSVDAGHTSVDAGHTAVYRA